MVATDTASPWADAEWAAALIALTGDTLGGVQRAEADVADADGLDEAG